MGGSSVNKEEVRSRIEQVGSVPAIRATFRVSSGHRLHCGNSSCRNYLDRTRRRGCDRKAEAEFAGNGRQRRNHSVSADDAVLSGSCCAISDQPGFTPEVVEFARKHQVAVLTAWKAGADLVKVFPCARVDGEAYIRALKEPFPLVPLIASGGGNPPRLFSFLLAGAAALENGGELMSEESVEVRKKEQIREPAFRFLKMARARARKALR